MRPQRPQCLVQPQRGLFSKRTSGSRGIEVIAEKGDCLVNGFQHATRLGLQRQSYMSAGAPLNIDEVGDVSDDVFGDLLHPSLGPGSERSGHRADASVRAFRQQLGKDVCQPVGIVQPRRIRPIGAVDIFLHPHAVEIAIGKSVDGENIGVGFGQIALERFERRSVRQPRSRGGRKAQTDPERFRTGRRRMNIGNVAPQGVERLLPGFALVDVGAVGQLPLIGLAHPHFAPARAFNFSIAVSMSAVSISCTSTPTPSESSSVIVSSPPKCS